jgi:hypothetical protein
MYLLWRVEWIRAHGRTSLLIPEMSLVVYPPLLDQLNSTNTPKDYFINADGNPTPTLRRTLMKDQQAWGNDTWSFGQILSLSIWLPAVIELVYILVGLDSLFLSLFGKWFEY